MPGSVPGSVPGSMLGGSKTFADGETGVRGVELLSKSLGAYTHMWSVDRVYEFVYGETLVQIGNSVTLMRAGDMVRVPADVVRAFAAHTEYVVMKYYMPVGPESRVVCTRLPGAQRASQMGYAIRSRL